MYPWKSRSGSRRRLRAGRGDASRAVRRRSIETVVESVELRAPRARSRDELDPERAGGSIICCGLCGGRYRRSGERDRTAIDQQDQDTMTLHIVWQRNKYRKFSKLLASRCGVGVLYGVYAVSVVHTLV